MKSTLTKDIIFENGVAKVVPKEYPNWYGIENIGFIWHNEWTDPEIEYKGKCCSCYIVEDTMWERYREENGKYADEELFGQYMRNNTNEVYELCELALFSD